VQRFEVLFGLFNAIFLLFIGMNMLKESLEHMMLEDDHHGGDHGAYVPITTWKWDTGHGYWYLTLTSGVPSFSLASAII